MVDNQHQHQQQQQQQQRQQTTDDDGDTGKAATAVIRSPSILKKGKFGRRQELHPLFYPKVGLQNAHYPKHPSRYNDDDGVEPNGAACSIHGDGDGEQQRRGEQRIQQQQQHGDRISICPQRKPSIDCRSPPYSFKDSVIVSCSDENEENFRKGLASLSLSPLGVTRTTTATRKNAIIGPTLTTDSSEIVQ